MPNRRITVERNRLRFAAAHMATFRGDCEPLHGHNYDVIIELEGELTGDAWIWDFGEVKRITKEIVDPLDHKFLLQRESKLLDMKEHEDEWEIGWLERKYRFPKNDVFPLPLDNTTSERIAEWVAGQLAKALQAQGATSIRKITVGIEEMPGQTGWYTVDLDASVSR
ncbi:MAG: 6-carboxytetrahydropterin synthase [Dehalococcoidia bacterium]|nr:6-carboxytetrahydropterin synthase [Dehalococcoidia bacterium]